MKIKCYMCNGMGETHEVILPPNDPQEWHEPCKECNATGKVNISLSDYIKDWIATLVFKITCLPYVLKYKKLEDNEIPF